MINKTIVSAMLFDHFLGKLSEKDTKKDYVFKECRKVLRKQVISDKKNTLLHLRHYMIANEAWLMAQNKLDSTEYSVITVLWFMLQKNSDVVKYFKLNIKNFERLKNTHDTSKHNFRSIKILNILDECIDSVISKYNLTESIATSK